jgi:hypothetical protein
LMAVEKQLEGERQRRLDAEAKVQNLHAGFGGLRFGVQLMQMQRPRLDAEASEVAQQAAAGVRIDPSCPICFEEYSESASVTPRILACGHTFCERCLAKLLAPKLARGGAKRLACPTCRDESDVDRGRAKTLPKNFVVLGA